MTDTEKGREPHSMDPAEPFTCSKHRGLENDSAAIFVLIGCPVCSDRATSVISRVGEDFSALIGVVAKAAR